MGCVIFPKLDSKTENVTFFGMGLFVIKKIRVSSRSYSVLRKLLRAGYKIS